MTELSTNRSDQNPGRLYYLDWLRVIAVFGVFLFHAVHPFDHLAWHIKNAEQSDIVTYFLVFIYPWGMPFFFLLSGGAAYFALRTRSAAEFARERFNRLLIPFFVGAAALMPIMLYFEWLHKSETGVLDGSFMQFVLDRNVGFTPIWFGALGYHLWFLGFLFAFSLLCLPIFIWLKRENGRRFTAWLARLCARRGAILLLFVPLAAFRLALHPFFPQEHSWADFAVQMTFFLLGYLLFSHPDFLQAVRRDWPITLAGGILMASVGIVLVVIQGTPEVESPPKSLLDALFWILISLDGWCWALFFLYIGMRYLDFTNNYLAYGQEAVLPFFVFHQPVIIVLAYYAVQWPVSLPAKLLFVVIGSFLVTLGIYEFVIRRVAWLSRLFGMKAAPPAGTGSNSRQPFAPRH